MRKGIVLFITLSVIVAMIALVGVIFSYLHKAKQDASYTAALIQADIFFRDTSEAISKLLKNANKDKNIKETILSTLYAAPLTLQPEDSELFTTIACSPLSNGVNINWLGEEEGETISPSFLAAEKVFDYLVDEYAISNATLLREKLAEAINQEGLLVPINPRRLKDKKGISSLSQLLLIVRAYQFETDDKGINSIPWEKFFSFDKDAKTIDGNYISAELIAILFEMDLKAVIDDWIEGEDIKEFASANAVDASLYNTKLFNTVLVEHMHCDVTYSYQGEIYSFGFDYLEEKAEKFEFYGKQ